MATQTPPIDLQRLFLRHRIADMPMLTRALGTSSRMTVFRKLRTIGYLSSYSHAGAHYTLADIPQFDEDGLWRFQGAGFSRYGTLKATSRHLIEVAEAGRTHGELEGRLHVRVHNTLLALVRGGAIGREALGGSYVYLSADEARAAAQLDRRRADLEPCAELASGELPAQLVIEVLVEVIHAAGARGSPPAIAGRLAARGVPVSAAEVEAIFREHGIAQKKGRSRSRCSPR